MEFDNLGGIYSQQGSLFAHRPLCARPQKNKRIFKLFRKRILIRRKIDDEDSLQIILRAPKIEAVDNSCDL